MHKLPSVVVGHAVSLLRLPGDSARSPMERGCRYGGGRGSEQFSVRRSCLPNVCVCVETNTVFCPKDKQTIDVIFPIDDWVESDHIIYRLGEDSH